MREFNRSERVSAQLQREIASIIQSELKDPRLGFVTVNEVRATRDLSVAKVYVGVLNGNHKESIAVLEKASPFIRFELGRRIMMRIIPEIRFIYDDSIEKGMKLTGLINNLNQSDD